ncbi:integrase core domain-containing protein [Streptomyces sp. NPDC059679]|uniref:integrase core domain-containing protein n=1 Tax=Streptomyces sp. NPDC059679 TaxID=3346903 RepID=UPI0036A01273
MPEQAGPAGDTWRDFLTSQAEAVIACDFPHIDLASLRRIYALVFLEHGPRRLHVAGVTVHPTVQWTAQQARNPALEVGVRLESLCFVIRDRETLRRGLLDHVLIWNETHARHVLDVYARHYNGHRPHQARGQRPPLTDSRTAPLTDSSTPRRLLQTRVLGGLINVYRHAA